jgi:hypothetical protein
MTLHLALNLSAKVLMGEYKLVNELIFENFVDWEVGRLLEGIGSRGTRKTEPTRQPLPSQSGVSCKWGLACFLPWTLESRSVSERESESGTLNIKDWVTYYFKLH